MTGRTIPIQGSKEVFAILGTGEFYRGQWKDVIVTKVGPDEEIPLSVRKSLVGLTIPTIFDKESLRSQGMNLPIPNESRLAYAQDVMGVLKEVGKEEEAEQLRKLVPNPLDMYVIEREIYKLV